MDNFKNMEPGIKDTAAFDSANKESKKKESRPVISAKAQTIWSSCATAPLMKPIPSVEWLATAREKVTSARLKQPICWQSTVSSITGLPKKWYEQRGCHETPSRTCPKVDGGGQGICGYKPALPHQCRADENLFRLQGCGGCARAPAIAIRR